MIKIEQMKARILAHAATQQLLEEETMRQQARRFNAKLTINWFLYGKRGIKLKFKRYNPY